MPLPDLIEIVPLAAPVSAQITVPGSKSITNRARVLAALAGGETELRGALWTMAAVTVLYADDAYGRALAYIDVVSDIPPAAPQEGYDVGKLLIQNGFSPVYVFEDEFARNGQYTQAEDQARDANRGSWAACGGNFHSEGG